ncbi:MAG: serine/threonine protein kinase [Cyanobacteria bacterium SZAS LIN-5]|nr:serine/threonine protein kinase [Cyanobacteria bacterium SZAS LIN-5]RTL45353.1 MAG: serine/threonine protein kinase [Candidatus Melainabacteria bacterium]
MISSEQDLSMDRFRIVSEVGVGGMGKVFQAVEQHSNKVFALKVMHNHLKNDPTNRMRFEREAKVAIDLRHKHIVEVTAYGFTESNEPFIVMEFLEGVSLQDVLKQKHRLELQEFFATFAGVCDGLSYAHESNVVHRDIKPSNIMLVNGDFNESKIVDFGIAKVCKQTGEVCPETASALKSIVTSVDAPSALNSSHAVETTVKMLVSQEGASVLQNLTQPGEIFGSPLYLSPEQCMGEEADCRSEVYTLGCVMFESLTGTPCLKGSNAMETLLLRVQNDAPSINDLDEGQKFPVELEKVVARALHRNPDERYQSVRELGTALKAANLDLDQLE